MTKTFWNFPPEQTGEKKLKTKGCVGGNRNCAPSRGVASINSYVPARNNSIGYSNSRLALASRERRGTLQAFSAHCFPSLAGFFKKNCGTSFVFKVGLLITFLVCHSLPAMEWPLPNAVMVSNFGFNDRGRPALGTVFEGEGDILAADGGELIFSRSEKDFASRLPSALGAWAAIDHGDGLVSIYGRYEDEGRMKQPPQVEGGTPIAKAGSSGWSRRDGFYFQLFDRKERRWVNASMVITPFPDTIPPQILGMQLRNAQDQVDNRLMTGIQLRISQGRYIIEVHAIDTLLNIRGEPLAPHRIVCSVNGTEAGVLSFETISARDGMLMVSRNGLIPALQVYANYPVLEVGEVQLNRGQAILEVIVQDIVGNSRNIQSRMIVE